jgi:acyl carrier protein
VPAETDVEQGPLERPEVLQLVEDLEKELGERVGEFRIQDEDLEDLKTVRDAVDYVLGRVGGASSN